MGLFGKRKNSNDDFKAQLEKEALEKLNNNEDFDYILPIEGSEILSGFSPIGQSKVHAKSVITPEEIMGNRSSDIPKTANSSEIDSVKEEKIPMNKETESTSADFLYNLMTKARTTATQNVIKTSEQQSDIKAPVSGDNQINPKKLNEKSEKAYAKFNTTLNNDLPIKETVEANSSPNENKPLDFESLFKALHAETEKYSKKNTEYKSPEQKEVITLPDTVEEKTQPKNIEEDIIPTQSEKTEVKDKEYISFLDRCNAYLSDEDSGMVNTPNSEKYKLESVEAILKSLEKNSSNRTKTDFMGNMNINFNDTTKKSSLNSFITNQEKIPSSNINDNTFSTEMPQKTEENSPLADESKTDNNVKTSSESINITKTLSEINTDEIKHHFVSKSLGEENKITKSDIISAKQASQTQIFPSLELKDNTKEVVDEVFSSSLKEENDDNKSKPDYSSPEERNKLSAKLKKLYTFSAVKSFLTFILLLASLLLLTPLAEEIKAIGVNIYHGLYLVFILISTFINADIFKSFIHFIKGKHNTDLPYIFSTLSVIGYTVYQLLNSSEKYSLVPLCLLSLFAASASKATKLKRIYKNFLTVTSERTKNAITVLNNTSSTKLITGKNIEGNALICYGKKAKNLTDFVKRSFCSDPNAKKIVALTIVGAVVGLLISIVRLIITGSLAEFLNLLSIFYCVISAPTVLLLTDLPINSASKRLNCYGAVLSGFSTANELDHCNALAADSKDIFPNGTIRLVDMKALSENSVYQSILDAIALTENIGSPLAEMFKQAIDTPSDKKLEVDSAVYEDKMGISGWVNNRRVFIGNRILMESHGFTNIPEIELDKKIMRKGYFPVYLACENTPCVLFVVKYFADDEIMYELKRLCNTGTTVFVKNCDPNISDNMLSDYFGLYKGSIHVMTRQGADQFSLITEEKENYKAGAVYTNSVCGLFATLTASIGIKKLSGLLYILYTLCTVLGLLVTTLISFTGILSTVNPWMLLLSQLILTVLTLIPVIFKRP